MKNIIDPDNRSFRYIVIITLLAVYVAIFTVYHNEAEIAVAALATIPVIGASWYFGVRGGVLTAIILVLSNMTVLLSEGIPFHILFGSPDLLIGTLALTFMALVVGSLSLTLREGRDAIAKLENYELERQVHTHFLEQLNFITGKALEADSLDSTLSILGQEIKELFQADHCLVSLWDDARKMPIPVATFGLRKEMEPSIQFEPGETTLTGSILELQRPLAIPDVKNSPYVHPRVAALFPSRSILGLPLTTQRRKLGALLLGYKELRSFAGAIVLHAELTAEQVSLLLSKSLLLEEERKQVRQLTALHDIALLAINVDDEDELINRVTDIIGQNLFPDNFGILLLDEPAAVLQAHPSYRFFSAEERHMMDVPLEKGITGLVARTGQAQRVADVHHVEDYFNIDERTMSELCVPIKFKGRILGVINAESTKKDAFTEDDERLLITLAGQIATALEQIRKAQAERKWLDQLAHANELIYALAQITTHIEKAFSIDDIIRNLGAELSKIDLTCITAVYDQERALFTVNYTSMNPDHLEIVELGLGYPLINHVMSRDRLKLENILYPTALSNVEEEIQVLLDRTRKKSIAGILKRIGIGPGTEPLRLPLIFEDTLLGILWIWGKGLTRADLPIMSIFAKQIGVSLERARLFQEVQNLALTDPLTGLHNRRSLFGVGRIEFTRAQRLGRPFSCMMLDLDHFKQINDEYGHLIGDQVLQESAKRCLRVVRDVDLVGRYGGEELLVLLPETGRDTCIQVAERLRDAIASTPIKIFDKELSLTVSIGVATLDENTTDLETLIARADQAMYISKHKGRNRVAVSK